MLKNDDFLLLKNDQKRALPMSKKRSKTFKANKKHKSFERFSLKIPIKNPFLMFFY